MSVQDFRQAIRGLRHAPGFTLAAAASIALGIAGNVAIFSLVNAILIRPLPYPGHERLITIKGTLGKGANVNLKQDGVFTSPPVFSYSFVRYREEVQSLESLEAVTTGAVKNMLNLDGPGEPERVGAVRVTSGFLNVLGIQPQLGRWFTRSEEIAGAPDVAIIGDSLWRRHFSADPGIIGRRILLEGRPHEVIGVTPSHLRFFRG